MTDRDFTRLDELWRMLDAVYNLAATARDGTKNAQVRTLADNVARSALGLSRDTSELIGK